MESQQDHLYALEFEVRDNECDLQGIVNNAVYLNYLEHTRHQYLRSQKIDFAALAEEGIFLLVQRVEVDYLHSLRSGDRFLVGLNLERVSPLRLAFVQPVYRLPDMKPVARGRTIGTGINRRGRPQIPEALLALMERAAAESTGGTRHR